MGSSQIPLTQGFKDVTRDYLNVWDGYRAELEEITGDKIAAFNRVAQAAGIAEVHIP